MSYHAAGETPDERLVTIDERTLAIIKGQKEDRRRRNFALTIGAIGALLAAARLGIIALPLIKARRRRKLGELGR